MIRKPLTEYRFSLRARATSWYVGLLAMALVVFSIGIYVCIRTYLNESLQRALSGTAHTIANDFLAKLPMKGDAWVLGEIRESYEASPNDHYIRLSAGNEVLYQTGDMRDPSIPIAEIALPQLSGADDFHRQTIQGRGVMIYSLSFHNTDGRLIEVEAGASLFSMQQTLHSLTKILTVATILILILATIGGYLLMKQPLRPLVVLTDKAAKIGRKGLGERLPVIPTGDELERLTHSLNGMIDRLEDALNHNHRFSADASHELRTPLTIMRGELEEMLRIEKLPAQAIENLVSTLEEIDRMSRIVNSLMVITRLDAGGERMAMQVLDLSALVRTTMDHMRLLAEEKGLPLNCACEQEVYVYADPMRIKQVLVNLIDNAIKYTQPGEVFPESSLHDAGRGRVDIAVFASGSSAWLKISDRGIGIAPEVLPHVFDRFYRADFARSREAGGVGLGLAIVKAIVAAHDGTVSITSTLDQGSTVLVQLPLVQPPEPVVKEEPVSLRKQSRYQTT
jgi:signal transduction histidine kinase